VPRVNAATVAEHRRQLLAHVFSSFGEVVGDRGYDAVTLADVAKDVGLTRTALYHYFPDKEALLVAFTEHAMDEHLSDLRFRLARVDDPLEKLDLYVAARIDHLARQPLPPGPGLRRVLSSDGYEAMRRYEAVIDEMLTAILEEAASEGEVATEVLDDGVAIPLVQACLASAAGSARRGKRRVAMVAGTQAFVRRAVGVRDEARPRRR
jgi:AcrR family transcriptional regulator